MRGIAKFTLSKTFLDRILNMSDLSAEAKDALTKLAEVCSQKSPSVELCLEFIHNHTSEIHEAIYKLSNQTQTDSHAASKSSCNHQSDLYTCGSGSPVKQWLLGYALPIMILLCLVCNAANLAVYNVSYLRKSTTVKLLTTKTITSTLFVICAVPSYITSIPFLRHSETVRWFHYVSSPYSLFLANLFGCAAAWITVLVTLERFTYVAFPFEAKFWFSPNRVLAAVTGIIVMSALLQMVYPITRFVSQTNCGNFTAYAFELKPGVFYHKYEQAYHWLNTILVLFLPTILMVTITFSLWYQFRVNKRVLNGERKKCLTRLTVATTVAQFCMETPQSIMFVSVGLYGTAQARQNAPHLCVFMDITNFLSILNASVSFLIYLACSAKFRQLFINRIRGREISAEEQSVPNNTLLGVQKHSSGNQTSKSRLAILHKSTTVDYCENGNVNCARDSWLKPSVRTRISNIAPRRLSAPFSRSKRKISKQLDETEEQGKIESEILKSSWNPNEQIRQSTTNSDIPKQHSTGYKILLSPESRNYQTTKSKNIRSELCLSYIEPEPHSSPLILADETTYSNNSLARID